MTQDENETKKQRQEKAAKRALEEAKARRAVYDAKAKALPEEKGGRGGLEPTRYEDWEIKGRTVDF